MVRYICTITSIFLVLTPAISALRVPLTAPHRDIACVPPQIQSLGAGGVLICSHHVDTASPAAQSLERHGSRPKPGHRSRKARAKTRVEKGKPPATPAEKGRTGSERKTKDQPAMSDNKRARVAERKENRQLGKKQKQAAKVAEALQKQRPPPYGINPQTGALRKPEEADVAKKVWTDKQKAQANKQARTAAYHALSPAAKAAHDAATAARQAAAQQKHKDDHTKENNRLNRINTKAGDRTARKAANLGYVQTAKAAYAAIPNLPQRHEEYTSPQGKPYTGRDTRQAAFSAAFATAKGGVGYNAMTGKPSKNKDKLPKNFENRPNSDGSHPLPGVNPLPGNPLKEFPLNHDKKMGHDGRKPTPSEARIITQQNAAGQTELKGRIGHPAKSDDHISF